MFIDQPKNSCRDPVEGLEWLLFHTGIVKAAEKANGLYPWIVAFTYLNLVADATISIYLLEDHPFDDKIETIQCCISFVHLIGKIFNLKFRSTTFWKLMDDSRNVWKEMAAEKENEKIVEDLGVLLKKTLKGVMIVSLVPVPISVILATLNNLSKDSGDWDTIYKNWDPIRDTLGEDWYWTRCIYEVIIMTYALYLFVAVYCALIIPCLIAAGQMKVLIRMLESENVNVRACVDFHQKILKYVEDINNLFAGQMFLDMALSALYISFRSYQVIQLLKNNDPRVLSAIFFLNVCFGAPFLLCICGHIINDMSEKVHRSAAYGQWYNLSNKDKKALCYLMCCTSKTLSLQYHNFMSFNMSQYGTMVQGTYSYITLLTGV